MNEQMRTWMPSKKSIQKGMNSIFTPNPWYYELRKEVRKRMAIDFRKEWKAFRAECGHHYLVPDPGSAIQPTCTLGNAMDTWIRNVILTRERLMEEYVKEKRITTDIDDSKSGDERFHKVNILDAGRWKVGSIDVRKDSFCKWLNKRKEVK